MEDVITIIKGLIKIIMIIESIRTSTNSETVVIIKTTENNGNPKILMTTLKIVIIREGIDISKTILIILI